MRGGELGCHLPPIPSDDESTDTRVEKSQLLARLDEMKKAIDGFKTFKSSNKKVSDDSE